MSMSVRRVTPEDQPQISYVESQATPNLRYLDLVFEEFSQDKCGDFSVVEMDGRIVGCAKLTHMPDDTGWLESLRVLPRYQGRGVGKLFYRHFFRMAQEQNMQALRMYTNEQNAASKGLAMRFGFREVAEYRGYLIPRSQLPELPRVQGWERVTDGGLATRLVLESTARWKGFLVMNRTFYAITPPLVNLLLRHHQIYLHCGSGSLLVMGSRFMPEQALHIALITGDLQRGLALAATQAQAQGAMGIQCMFPPGASYLEDFFVGKGFTRLHQDLVVMEADTACQESMKASSDQNRATCSADRSNHNEPNRKGTKA